MKVTFLNLTPHLKSRSNKWLSDYIAQFSEVTVCCVDTDPSVIYDVLISEPDLVICFQCDLLAPWFLANGIPAISIPMADACENMPEDYFSLSGMLGSVSFTQLIREKFYNSNNETFNLKFFPKIEEKIDLERKDIDVFYGFRGKHWSNVIKLYKSLRNSGLRLHTHNATDNHNEKNFLDFDSLYFSDVDDLYAYYRRSKFYLCPRDTEGIGLSTLNAMRFGLVPIALNGAGNEDYIKDGLNGILIDQSDLKKSSEEQLGKILTRRIKNFNYDRAVKYNLDYLAKGKAEFDLKMNSLEAYLFNRVNYYKSSKTSFTKQNRLRFFRQLVDWGLVDPVNPLSITKGILLLFFKFTRAPQKIMPFKW